jgi:hypothetical protein
MRGGPSTLSDGDILRRGNGSQGNPNGSVGSMQGARGGPGGLAGGRGPGYNQS